MKTEIVKSYFALLENFSSDMEHYHKLLHPEMNATIFPNLLSPKVHVYDQGNMLQGITLSRTMLSSQRYEIVRTVEAGDTLVMEAKWTGTMQIDAGALKKGQALMAHICFIFEFKEGKIFRQRNYDCYEPFTS